MQDRVTIVMIGATGAVGGQVLDNLARSDTVERMTLLGRRPVDDLNSKKVTQHTVDMFDSSSYEACLQGHTTAICTFGVGEPTKVSKAELLKVDKTAVLAFAAACKGAGVRHFQLLGSVGANANSPSFFLRTKGQLEDELKALSFDRLSLFRPSMILTPTNRYGMSQAITLAVWPKLSPLLAGPLRKYRGVKVNTLGRAIAANALEQGRGIETLHWDEIQTLAKTA